jgi:hypothetical protein
MLCMRAQGPARYDAEKESNVLPVSLILAVFTILFLSVIVGLLTPYSLQRKFVKLGVLEGRTKDEIIAAVGPPSEISVDGAGRTILKWRSRYFRIALGFDPDGKCSGVSR